MFGMRSLFGVTLLLLVCASHALAEKKPNVDSDELQAIKDSVLLYFESTGGFQKGDLVCRSQIEEVQSYLRKTRGHSLATHPRLLNRFLADESRLSRLFYMKNGATVLRKAAEKTAGYSVFDKLSHKTASLKKLNDAVEKEDIQALIELGNLELAKQKNESHDQNSTANNLAKRKRLYTVEDFLDVITSSYQESSQKRHETTLP